MFKENKRKRRRRRKLGNTHNEDATSSKGSAAGKAGEGLGIGKSGESESGALQSGCSGRSSPTPSLSDSLSDSPSDLPSPTPSYADVVQLLGRPHVTLPTSQLTLGRTSPPWNAMCWKALAGCAIRNGVLRVQYALGGSSFLSIPSCFPCEHATLHFGVRFGREWCTSCGFGGGRFPGLVARGEGDARALFALAWLRNGRMVALVHTPGSAPPTVLLERAALQLRTDGVWNDVVLRVKLNAAGRGGGDGEVSISVNGAAAMHAGATWSTLPLRLAGLDMTTKCRSKRMPPSAHADFANFGVVV